jgi:hypothetical protein
MSSKKLYIVDWKSNSPTHEKVIYTLELDQLEKLEELAALEADDPILSPLLPLIDRNVAFAAIPENFGEGCACYLLNLNSFKGKP